MGMDSLQLPVKYPHLPDILIGSTGTLHVRIQRIVSKKRQNGTSRP